MKNKYNLLYSGNKKDFYNLITKRIKTRQKTFIVTANSEIFSLGSKSVKKILNNRNYLLVCDGIALTRIASKKTNKKLQKIPGIEITDFLFDQANKNKLRVYIYGSKEKTIEKTKEMIVSKYSKIDLISAKNGYDNNLNEVKQDIIKNKPDILIVALGVPKQELFIDSIYDKLDSGIMIGVGGSLDNLSGAKKRAPKWIQNNHLEWLYRILKEPSRLPKFIKSNFKLMTQKGDNND